MFYDGPTPSPEVFADFDAIEALVSTTETKSYYDMSNEAGGAALVGFGNSFREITYPNLPESEMVEFLNTYWNTTYERTLTDGLQTLGLDIQITGFTPQPLSVRVVKASNAQGENALGLDPDNGDRIWIENQFLWGSGALCKERCPVYAEGILDELLTMHKAKYANVKPTNYKSGDISFTNYNPLFMNDAAPNQDPYASYGAKNLAKLKAAKQKYDPNGFFTTRQGGFKLPS